MSWTIDSVEATADSTRHYADGTEVPLPPYLDVSVVSTVGFKTIAEALSGFPDNAADFSYLVLEVMHDALATAGADFTYLILEVMHDELVTFGDTSVISKLGLESIVYPQFPIEFSALHKIGIESTVFVSPLSFSAETSVLSTLGVESAVETKEVAYTDVSVLSSLGVQSVVNNFIPGSITNDVLEVLVS